MATLTSKQLKDSYQSLVTIGDSITSNPTSGVLENGLGNPVTRLGIGTSTEDWSSIFDVLRVGKTASLFSYDSIADGLFLGSNVYFDTTLSEYAYISTDPATLYQGINGDHIFINAPSGTADTQATFTERMRIHSGGDISFRDGSASEAFYWDASAGSLGIGTTSPSYALDVTGDIALSDDLYVSNGNFIKLQRNSGGLYLDVLGTPSGTDDVRLLTSGAFDIVNGSLTSLLKIDSSGNVGIGTTSPSSYGGYSALTLNGSSNGGVIDFKIGDTRKGSVYNTANGELFVFDATSATAEISLQTNSTERMRIDSSGNVLVGTTTAPGSNGKGIAIYQSDYPRLTFRNSTTGDGATDGTQFAGVGADFEIYNKENGFIAFGTNNAERMRILSSGGITFNGDTASANALDDYEEGTWTMGVAFGGGTTGITYTRQGGTYTKIGRQVTVCGDFILSSKGSATGNATITGLPFTINGGSTDFLQAASFRFAELSFSELVQGYGGVSTTVINMEQVTSGAGASAITHADFENATQLMVSLTYFV